MTPKDGIPPLIRRVPRKYAELLLYQSVGKSSDYRAKYVNALNATPTIRKFFFSVLYRILSDLVSYGSYLFRSYLILSNINLLIIFRYCTVSYQVMGLLHTVS